MSFFRWLLPTFTLLLSLSMPNANGEKIRFDFNINFLHCELQCWGQFTKACPNDTKLIILLPTRRDGFDKRELMRQTWLKDTISGEEHRFLISGPSKEEADNVQSKLEAEQKRHGDMVFLHGFVDKYKHLHLKMYGGYHWQQSFCANAEWVMKVDDDAVVHIRRWAKWADKKFRQISTKNPLVFFGYAGHSDPVRDPESKWYAPMAEYPEMTYPPYVFGATYWTTTATISTIMKRTNEITSLFLEDVLYTGLLPLKANVTVSQQNTHIIAFPADGLLEKECGQQKACNCVGADPTTIAIWQAHEKENFKKKYEILKKMSCPTP